MNKKKGFSVIEIVLAAALFAVFSLAITLTILQGSSATQAGIRSQAVRLWAREGVDAVRAIRNQSFDDLQDTSGTGVRFADGKWEFSGSEDSWEGYKRIVTIQPARRDADDNIVISGGSEDADLKLVTVTVSKNNFSMDFSAYLSRREIVLITP